MTEKKAKDKETDNHQETTKKTDSQPNHASKKPGLITLCFFISIIALLTTSFSFWQSQMRDQSLNQELSMTNQSISSLVDKQQSLSSTITGEKAVIQKQISQFAEELDRHKQFLNDISRTTNQNQSNWKIKKARFYLQLAQINAHWSQPSQTTVDLLKQADNLFIGQHQPAIYDIRQQIAREISDIEDQSGLDIVGLLSKLTTIQTQLRDLTYRDQPLLQKKKNEAKTSQDKTKQYWANSVNVLEKLVVIRYHQQPVKPILSDEQFGLVKEGLYIDLQQAKWAVINRNQGVFDLAIKQAISEIQYHFNDQTSSVEKILTSLQSLKTVRISQKPVVPTKALAMTNQFLKQQDEQNTKPTSSGGKH